MIEIDSDLFNEMRRDIKLILEKTIKQESINDDVMKLKSTVDTIEKDYVSKKNLRTWGNTILGFCTFLAFLVPVGTYVIGYQSTNAKNQKIINELIETKK